jgi:hypothetical protein
MAVTANQIVKRQGGDGKLRAHGVATNKHLYEGTLSYLDANGYASDVINTDVGKFIGIVREEVDNTGGADGAKISDFWTEGDFELPMSTASLVAADINKTVYGVDNYALSETATDQPEVGKIVKIVSTSVAVVSIKGLGEGIVAPGT